MFRKIFKSISPISTTARSPFQSMLADGGDIKLVSDFDSVQSLYNKLSAVHNLAPSDILFCTINTSQRNMGVLLSSSLELNDVIFVHRAGSKCHIDFTSNQDGQPLGITVTDNGAGIPFIKKIKEESLLIGKVEVGDHIQEIDDVSMVGKSHVEVVTVLKKLGRGTHTMTLIKPITATPRT